MKMNWHDEIKIKLVRILTLSSAIMVITSFLAAMFLTGCGGNARTPNNVVEDALQNLREHLQQLVGKPKEQIIFELGEPQEFVIDEQTKKEIMTYQLTDADMILILDAQSNLERYLFSNKQ
jgi:hypothetical protein